MPQLHATVLLFDMDGTLVDSTALVESTWAGFCEAHRLDLAEVLAFAHGRPTRETVAHFLTDPALAAAETRRLVAHEESETTGITEVPGARALLTALPAHTWAVVTSASRRLAEVRMAAAGLPMPEVLVSADEVTRGKPDPEGYLRAAARLGCPPQDAVVVEDSDAGVRAGLAACGRTVVIGGLDTYDEVAVRWADFRGFRVVAPQAGVSGAIGSAGAGGAAGVTLDVPEPVAAGQAVRA
ncbi:HAD-IA family hydrolase [Streptacidiphilus fuscans]|uniref:HAD-IA family hydrolase n=1 Tax=Streptacidiphilus fuscans TaxID=2789292 RepID=A0A931FBJ1_9ACTN|nr:HAD-IA family hydrolase [Streptacidiphilus fuscans]MBF9067503.1 HAD-IA family hydrolase [Streptacidiphilus fuscans]